jgi:hypothetical protein
MAGLLCSTQYNWRAVLRAAASESVTATRTTCFNAVTFLKVVKKNEERKKFE